MQLRGPIGGLQALRIGTGGGQRALGARLREGCGGQDIEAGGGPSCWGKRRDGGEPDGVGRITPRLDPLGPAGTEKGAGGGGAGCQK